MANPAPTNAADDADPEQAAPEITKTSMSTAKSITRVKKTRQNKR
jgi:hypothetical protein